MRTDARASHGVVRGRSVTTEHGPIAAFLGVPYAAPPTGPRRFTHAVPAAEWSSPRDATKLGASQPQHADPFAALLGLAGGDTHDEDCLTVNVWTPDVDDLRRPVLVWIHGGAFISGTSAAPVLDGARLSARGDIVVVTFNYRVGALGFLYLDEQRSNFGLGDQIAALSWVRDNIAAFGGDPKQVTIAGQSAGAGSVCALMASPAAKGLFHAAIVQSAAPHGFVSVDEAVERRERVFAQLREAGHAPELDAGTLERLPLAAWLDAQAACAQERQWRTGMLFTPVVGGALLPSAPLQAVREGREAGVPLLIGSTRDELQLFGYGSEPRELARAHVEGALAGLLPGLDVAAIYTSFHAARSARGESLAGSALLQAVLTELAIRVPSLRLAEWHAGHGHPTFMYLFEWSTPIQGGALGACHGLDLPFVFGTLELPALAPLIGFEPEARALAQRMMDAWIAFVRHGRPAAAALGEWPAYDDQRRATMRLGAAQMVDDDPRAAERQALSFI